MISKFYRSKYDPVEHSLKDFYWSALSINPRIKVGKNRRAYIVVMLW
jgi:hypothetical protein